MTELLDVVDALTLPTHTKVVQWVTVDGKDREHVMPRVTIERRRGWSWRITVHDGVLVWGPHHWWGRRVDAERRASWLLLRYWLSVEETDDREVYTLEP